MAEPALTVILEDAQMLNNKIKRGGPGGLDEKSVLDSLKKLDKDWAAMNKNALLSGHAKLYDKDMFDTTAWGYKVLDESSEEWTLEDIQATSQGFVVAVDELGNMTGVKHLAVRVEVNEHGQKQARYYGFDVDTLQIEVDEMSFERAKALLECYAPGFMEKINERLCKEDMTLGEEIEALKDIDLGGYIKYFDNSNRLLPAIVEYVNRIVKLDRSVPYSSILYGNAVQHIDDNRASMVHFSGQSRLLRVNGFCMANMKEKDGDQKISFAVDCEIFEYEDANMTSYSCVIPVDAMCGIQSIRELYYQQ